MKPSPMLEEIRARHEADEAGWLSEKLGGQTWAHKLHSDRAALLALISAQPGGDWAVRICGVCETPAAIIERGGGCRWPNKAICPRPTSPDPARAEQVPEREGK